MSRAAEEFVQTVEQFCQWAEEEQHDLVEARHFLALLIGAIPKVAEFRYASVEEEAAPQREFSRWEENVLRFSDLPMRYYRVIFSPLESADEPVTGDLHDDFADIYSDLRRGLQAHRSGKEVEALSHWVDSYFHHWGRHAASALYAIDAFYREEFQSG